MKSAGRFFRRSVMSALGVIALTGSTIPQTAAAQAPYLLPYTIQVLAGGGTAPVVGATCTGANGAVGSAYDTMGNGCPVTSSSVVVGGAVDLHDVVIDPQGNIYFLDNTSANAVVRRIDARSGVITVYAGLYGTQTICSTAVDKYGDGCPANDGKANAAGGYTASFAKARGLGVGRNGDVYIADYSGNIIHRISAATGIMTDVVGVLGTGTKATSISSAKGYSGDGGPGTAATENSARGVGVAPNGDVYIADSSNNVVRKLTASTGIISTFAGIYPGSSTSATAGFGGDGGPALSALFATPEDIEVDASGDVFIGDFGNNRVRVVYEGGAAASTLIAATNNGAVAAVGNIYTVVGGGTAAYTSAAPALATSVAIGNPRKIALDARGNVYVADNGFSTALFIDATTGYLRVVAGIPGVTSAGAICAAHSDAVGDNCPGTQATLSANAAMGVAVDSFGNVLISDSGDARLRRVNTNQSFPNIAAGSSVSQILDVHFAVGDGPGATPFTIAGSTDFSVTNSACTVNPDNTQDCLLTVSFNPTLPGRDSANILVKSASNGTVSLGISGVGLAASLAFDPGNVSVLTSTLKNPTAITQDTLGNVYIADTGANVIRRYTPAGTMTVVAGTGSAAYTGDSSAATGATLNAPRGIAVTRAGFLYIADTGNNVIRRIDPVSGVISTVAGGATAVCVNSDDTFGDGCPGTAANLSGPTGLAADPDGNIFFSDTGNNVIREFTHAGTVALVAGGAANVCIGTSTIGNGCPALQVTFAGPTGLAIDAARNIFVADTGNNQVRKLVAASNLVIAMAGNGQGGASGNTGPAVSAQLNAPTGVALDAAGDIYIADTANSAVRIVNLQGTINTSVGILGASGTGSVPGSAFIAQLSSPAAVSSNGAGRLVVLDSGNNRALIDDRSSVVFNFGRTTPSASSPSLPIQETSTGSSAASLSGAAPATLFTSTGNSSSFALAGTGSNGCTSGQSLAPGNSCLLNAQFNPSALGPVSAVYTESTTNTINSPAPSISISGTGAVLTKTSAVTVVTGTPQFSTPFNVTTTVTPTSCDTSAPSCTPSGTVSYLVDNVGVGLPTALTNGSSTFSVTGLSVGTHTVTAVYSGDGFYAGSSAAAISVTVAQATTTTVVSASPTNGPQFAPITLNATVTAPIKTDIPTGSVSFYAGTTLLGTAGLGKTGSASLSDVFIAGTSTTTAHKPNSFGLPAGTYNLTAVYSGDANNAASTSAGTSLIIAADAPSFLTSLSTSATGTAQGSTAFTVATITPSNTLNGTVTFACTGMPANSTCTFSPTSLTFTPVPGIPVAQQVTVTLWTDVPPGVIPTTALNRPALFSSNSGAISLATLLGWPVLLTGLVGILGFRKRLRHTRLLTILALACMLTGGSVALSGCNNGSFPSALTPTGVYNVNVVITGPSGTTPASIPVQFTVAQGVAGQL